MKQIMFKNKLKNLLYILAGLGGISLVIIIHEMGHFLFAKFFGVPTPTFSLGFGPALFSLPIGETIFQVALLPFGGYVEMNPEALAAQPYIPKMLIISAGILFNLIFAYCILLYCAIRNQFTITPTINTITPNSPAEHAGLHAHDIIIACDNETINENNVESLLKKIAQSVNKTIIFTIERDGTVHTVPITISADHPLFGPHTGWLGIELHKEPLKQTSFLSAIKTGHANFTATLQSMGSVVSTTMSQKGDKGTVVGPIGIISIMGKSLAISQQFFWLIVAMISLNIGLFNIIPLPFFDGGKALIYTIEALTGTTISATFLWYITMIFLTLFMLFIARVTMNDVKRLNSKK